MPTFKSNYRTYNDSFINMKVTWNNTHNLVHMGASTVKWTSLHPCSGLSESDPKLYTKFEFHEIEIHKHLENI